jgi:AmiR/NasT family two-component response regulator
MSCPLRIAVAEDESELRDYFQETLSKLGHQVVCMAQNGRELVESCRHAQPDLVITDIKMPDLDGIEAASEVCRNTPIPVILVSAYHDPELIARAEASQVFAFLVKPIKKADLETAIAISMRRFGEFQVLHKQANDLRQALEDRKVIERAKGIVMKRARLDEEAAFRRLQKVASQKNAKLVEIARTILAAEDALAPPEGE